eukprot:gene1370-1389_t
MTSRKILLAGTSAVALLLTLGSANASSVESFTFGTTSNVVTATTAQAPSAGAITSLSSQVNNQLSTNASLDNNSATTATGVTIQGGPSATSSNVMSATAIANQFSNGSGAAYVVDPINTPAAGNAIIGTSQLNFNSSATTSTARLGQLGTSSQSTVTVSPSTASSTSYTGSTGTVSVSFSAGKYTVTSVSGTTPYTVGQTVPSSTFETSDGSYSYGALSFASSSATNSFSTVAAVITPSQPAVTSQSTVTIGGTANSATFVADAAYGAPVAVSNNTFAARINGNLELSSISGGLPLSAIAAGPASLAVTGVAETTPVGTSITVKAPISVSNVQQNLTNNKSATKLTGSVANTLVSALFTGAAGFNGGSVATSGNAITANAAGNSATVGVNLDASSLPVFSGGASVFSAQGNSADTASAATLTVEALNQTNRITVQLAQSSGALSNMTDSNAALSTNSITSRAVLNDITAQTLTTGSTLYADGNGGIGGSAPTAVLISPQMGTAATLTATADYLNASVQRNNGGVSGIATTDNAVIGYFGGVSNGTVTVQGNTISTAVQGNGAVLTTTMPYAAGDAQIATAALQNNDGTTLTGTLSGTQLRVSESAQMPTDVSTATFSPVTASTGSTGTLTNANLLIGSATSAALGNTVSSTVLGNNATANATLGLAMESTINRPATIAVTSIYPGLYPAGTLVSVTAPQSVSVVQQNVGVVADSNITHPDASTGNNLFQIDAYSGLTNGTATIGNNTLRSTAAGNLAAANAAVSGFGGNLLAGGIAVGTDQGNVASLVMATLGTSLTGGPVATIGIGDLTNGTAQVVNNTFAAVAAGNSASASLAIASGTLAGGAGVIGNNFAYGSNVNQQADYLVGNNQVNAGTQVVATNLDAATDAATIEAALSPTGLTGALASITSLPSLTSHLNVGASSFDNAQASVNGNTVSTTALGNEYVAAATGFVAPAVPVSAATATSLSMFNVQMNVPSLAGNTNATSINIGNGFIVATADSNANATNGISAATSGGTVTNSILSVANNTVSATAGLNTATMTASGIATSGAGYAQSATVSGNLDNNAPAASAASSVGPVTVSNVQANVFSSTGTSLPAVTAISALQDFGVNWNSTGTAPSGSQFLVNGNVQSASATANNATLSASLANGPSFTGGVGLNNVQFNVGDPTVTPFVPFTTSAGISQLLTGLDSSVVAGSIGGFFNAGTGLASNHSDSGKHTEDSTISVSNNSMTAASTVNQAALSVTTPANVLVQANNVVESTATASHNGTIAEATASIAVANQQALNGTNSVAASGLGVFSANASANNGVVNVNTNSVTAAAIGNTATTTLAVPRMDGSMEAFNAQSASDAAIASAALGNTIGAGSFGSNTTITPVSVSNNLVTASSTVNNYAATMTGLGQTIAATSANSSLSIADNSGVLTADRLGGELALVSNQAIEHVTSGAVAGQTQIGITLANVQTTNSPLSVNSNVVTATANGNVSAQSLLANGAGAANTRAGFGIASAQALTDSTVLANAQSVNVGVTSNGSSPGTTYAVANSPVSVTGNSVGAGATGNSASLTMAFGASNRATGTGANSASSIAQGTTSSAIADYGLLNTQKTSGGFISAVANNVTMGYSGTATASPVNVQNNTVYATAFGNTATMAQTAALAGGSMQSTNYQSNVGTTVTASVLGTSMSAAMSSGASTNAPINVTGNVIRAVAVGPPRPAPLADGYQFWNFVMISIKIRLSMIAACTLVAAVASAMPAFAADRTGEYSVRGAGAQRCDAFVASVEGNKPDLGAYIGYIDGTLTTTSRLTGSVFDVNPFVLPGPFAAIVVNICKQTPDRILEVAVRGAIEAVAKARVAEKSPIVQLSAADLRMNIRMETLKSLQLKLRELKLLKDPADGVFGASTQAALKQFQSTKKLPETSLPDPDTILSLLKAMAMRKTVPVFLRSACLIALVVGAFQPHVARAQSHGHQNFGLDGSYGPGFPRGGLGIGASGVSIGVNQQGGVSINIANVGAASSFFGPSVGSPYYGTSLSGVPGFTGGNFNVFGGAGGGANSNNVNVGGGYTAPGGVSINIANVALTNNYYGGFGGYGYGVRRRLRHPHPHLPLRAITLVAEQIPLRDLSLAKTTNARVRQRAFKARTDFDAKWCRHDVAGVQDMTLSVLHLLSRAREQMLSRQFNVARHYLEAVLAQDKANVDALLELGRIAIANGEVGKAEGYGKRILSLNRVLPPALGHLVVGNARRLKGDHAGAVRAYRSLIRRIPNHAEGLCNLGGSLVELQLWQEAIDVLRPALALAPNDAAILANLGLALSGIGQKGEAIDALYQSVQIVPIMPAVWLALGSLMLDVARLPEAAYAFQKAIEQFTDPKSIGVAQYNLALVLILQTRRRDALVMLAMALERCPELGIAEGAMLYQAQWLCHWEMVDHVAPKVLARIRSEPAMVIEPFSAMALPGAENRDHWLAAAAYARRKMPQVEALVPRGHRWDDGRSRLRVGFLCADFRDHPMGVLMSGLLGGLNTTQINPVAISYGTVVDDNYRRACISACDEHVDLNEALAVSDFAAASAIAALRLDVLVDLQCYTNATRSGMLCYRPAPVQGHYLVYPSSAACKHVYDFTILDDVMCPADEGQHYPERVLRFSDSYFPVLVRDAPAKIPRRIDHGLPETGIVFVAMTQTYKISKETFSAWCEILRRVPGSVIWIAAMPAEAEGILRKHMAGLGIDPARMVLAPPLSGQPHRDRLFLADIGLDTWPYGAHTTAMDLLTSQIPIVTFKGEANPGRVASSILTGAGLVDHVQLNRAGYVDMAVRLGTDPAFFHDVKSRVCAAFSYPNTVQRLANQALQFGHILSEAHSALALKHLLSCVTGSILQTELYQAFKIQDLYKLYLWGAMVDPATALSRRMAVFSGLIGMLAGPKHPSATESLFSSQSLWESFKRRFIDQSGRIIDNGNGYVSHSEGQAYGLIFATYFDDQDCFTSILSFTERELRRPSDPLHAWRYIPFERNPVPDLNNATDGDLLIAFALARAGRRWGKSELIDRARKLASVIRTSLVRRVGDRLFLLPGLRASLDSSPTWRILRDDGLDALDKARFGQWQLPTDWVDVRVARGGLTNSPAAGSIARYWASFEGQSVPAWINVVNQEVSHFTETAGEFSHGCVPRGPSWRLNRIDSVLIAPNENEIKLTSTEVRVVKALMSAGGPLDKRDLSQMALGRGYNSENKSLDV